MVREQSVPCIAQNEKKKNEKDKFDGQQFIHTLRPDEIDLI